MGAFDDLIPTSKPGAVLPSEPNRGYFGDLIPEKQPEPETVGQVRGFFGALQRGVKAIGDLPDTIALANRSGLDDSGIAQYRAHRIGQLTGESGPEVIYRTQRAAAERVARNIAENQAAPRSEAQQRLERAEGWGKFGAFAKDPLELTASIIAESLPASVAGAVGGAVVGGPVGAVAGVGISSGLMTFANELLGNAASRGVDLQNPASLSDWLRSDAYQKDADAALKKSVVVGAIDAGTAGMAGRFVVPAIRTGLMRSVAVASAKEIGLQAVAGAGGEALGSVAAGQKIDPFNVFAEAIAEVGSGPAEVAGNFRSRSKGIRSRYQAPETPIIQQPDEPQERPAVQVPVQPVSTVTAPQAVEATPVVREESPVKGGERVEERQERPQEVLVESGVASVAPENFSINPRFQERIDLGDGYYAEQVPTNAGDRLYYRFHGPEGRNVGQFDWAYDAVNKVWRPDTGGTQLNRSARGKALGQKLLSRLVESDDFASTGTSPEMGTTSDAIKMWQRMGATVEAMRPNPDHNAQDNAQAFVIRKRIAQPAANAPQTPISRPTGGTGDRSVEGAVEVREVPLAEVPKEQPVVAKSATTPAFQKGDQVIAEDYGKGVVHAVLPNGRISIKFDDGKPIGVASKRVRKVETPTTEQSSAVQPVERVKVGKSPQPYTVLERLPASEIERQNGEQPVRVKNEKTGEESVVLEAQLTAIKEKTPEAQPVSGRTAGSSEKPAERTNVGQEKIEHHVAEYGGKKVVIDYVAEKKNEFKVAAQRVSDNLKAGEKGYVTSPDGKRYEISLESRKAKLIPSESAPRKMDGTTRQVERPIGPAPAPEFTALHPNAQKKFNEAWDANDIGAMRALLHLENKGLRAEFEKRMGVTLPKTVSGTRDIIERYFNAIESSRIAESKANTPANAQSKMQAEVSSVAKTEGTRPAKEIKSELIQRLEEAIEKAPTEEKAVAEAIRKTGATPSLNATQYEAQKTAVKSGKQLESITIQIPGDGTFKVWNTKEHLTEILKRAKRLATSTTGAGGRYEKSGTKGTMDDSIRFAIRSYGSPEEAYRRVKAQLEAVENPSEFPDTPELRDELFKRTAAGKADSAAKQAQYKADTYRRQIESEIEPEIHRINALKRPTKQHSASKAHWRKRLEDAMQLRDAAQRESDKFSQEAARLKAQLEAQPPKGSAESSVASGGEGSSVGASNEVSAQTEEDPEAGKRSQVSGASMEEGAAQSGTVLWASPDEIRQVLAAERRRGENNQPEGDGIRAGATELRAGSEQASRGVPSGTRFFVEENETNENPQAKRAIEFLTNRIRRGAGDTESQPAKDAADFNRALAAKLSDLKIFFLALGDKAAPANATGERLVINTSIFQRLDPENAEAVAYTDAVLAEELLHAATFRLSSSDDIINVWRSLSGLEQGLVKRAYQRIDVSDFLGGSEYIRMILQERLRGEITEQHDYRNTVTDFLKSELRKLVNFLKRIFGAKSENDIARQIIERIEAAIRGEPPIPGSVFNATPPVESGTRSVAETLLTADREAAGEEYIPTEVFGIRDSVLGKTQYTDEARAKSLGIAEQSFKDAGLEVTREANGHFQLVPKEKEQNEAGRKLVDAVKREIQKYGQGSLEVTELVQSLVLDFKNGRMDKLFSLPIRNELYSLAQGERSFRGVSLNALRGAGEDIKFIAQNIDVHLQRIWREAYGGEQIKQVVEKIKSNLMQFFTPEVVAQIVNENPELAKVKDAQKIIKDGLDSEWANLKELQDKYRDALIKAGVDAKAAPGLAKQIVDALRPRIRLASEESVKKTEGELTADHKTAVNGGKKPIWQRIVDAVKRGEFDDAPLVQERAKQNGWNPPSEDEIARIKRLAERERQLHELSKKERDAAKGDPDKLRRESVVREQSTLPSRLPLMREMEAAWARITKPVNFGRGLWRNRTNNAAFINELTSANLLLRLSFAPKQALSVLSQFMVHVPTRAIAQAIELHAQNREQGQPTALAKDIYDTMNGSFKAALAGYKDGVAQFVAALRGRGEARNVDRLLSGIAAIERIDAKAKQYADEGKWGLATAFKLMSFIRLGYRIAQAFDNLHGVPSEYVEMRNQAVMGLMRNGVERSAANAQADNIIQNIKARYITAMQEAKAFLDANGETYTPEKLRETAHRIARRLAYEDMRALKLPADDFIEANRGLRETIGWNEREAALGRGLGGVVGASVAGLGKVGEAVGIPLALGRFGNAIAIGINRALHFTPMGFFPQAFGEGNAWFRTELDRTQRKVEASVGTSLGTIAFLLALSGVFVVRLKWPEDKEERDIFEAEGRRPGTLEIPHGDGSFTAISLNTGLAQFLAPYLAAGGALREKLDEREKAQAKLNAEAAAKGLAPEAIRPMSVADLAGVAARAGYQTLLGSRTAAGAAGALSDYGNLNVTKAVASQVAPLVPTLPGLQEVSRMGGVVLDSKLASFGDFLLPLPSSPARRVNFLGEPSGTPDDMQRIVQILSGGSYWNVDPETAKTLKPYQILFDSSYRPPSIDPNKGYAIGNSFRPFNDAELERYSVLRGQEFRRALEGLGEGADEATVRRAYRVANDRALGAMGVQGKMRKVGTGRRKRSRGLRSRRGGGLRSLRSRRSGLRSARFSYV